MAWKPRYFDIGVNLSDSMFRGTYHGSTKHVPDLKNVISRAHLFNVDRMLVTASTIEESRSHLELCAKFPGRLFSTAGVHPCSVASEFSGNVEAKLADLKDIVEKGYAQGLIKSFGEIGLDYDRLHYSTKEQQTTMFARQLEVVASLKHLKIPLFLHMRNACDDFVDIIEPFIARGDIERGNGVVHSFTGSKEELDKLLDLGFYIGVNGCSLKTEENLKVARQIPRDRLMIETDAPWCEIRKSHASHKYISGYGNKFYPAQENRSHPPQIPSGKKAPIKLDPFLPLPVVKPENFAKHSSTVQTMVENHPDPESIDYDLGPFAQPVVKSRNEPAFVGYVAEIMTKLYGLNDDEIEAFVDEVYANSCRVFKVEE